MLPHLWTFNPLQTIRERNYKQAAHPQASGNTSCPVKLEKAQMSYYKF